MLGMASSSVQSTQALPWERQAAQQEVVQTLSDMKLALIASFKKSPSAAELLLVARRNELWPNLKAQSPLSAAEVSKVSWE